MATKASAALAELAQLGSSLADVAEDKAKQQETLGKILDTIGTLDKDTAKELFKDPQVQRLIELASGELAETSDDRPGSIRSGPFGQKKPWNEADLTKLIESGEMEMVRNYRPITTTPVIWNGLRRDFRARQLITCPGCFIYVYEQSLTAQEIAEQHAAWLMRMPGSDRLEDWSVVTEGGLRARGTGTPGHGHYVPGGGNVAMGDREE
jgi:hypothetical protein